MLTLFIAILLPTYGFAEMAGSPGESWKFLTDNEKFLYALGYKSGMLELTKRLFAQKSIDASAYNNVRDYYFKFDQESVGSVMTELYDDPANAYIFWQSMFLIAYHKIHGNEINAFLEEARKEGQKLHEKVKQRFDEGR